MCVDFHNIRPIRGSQQNGFEELCCQLAHTVAVAADSRFIRNGTPDGGVEAFWTLPDGTEHCWQAKYFFGLEDSHLAQLDDSVRTALARHPQLTEYTVCLPIDLPDARLERQRSARQKWEARVATWKAWAVAADRTVEFTLWGEHEIVTQLAEPKHAGKRWFWFRHIELSPRWFQDHIAEQIHYAGPRYTEELRVELPIARVFESLGHTASFRRVLRRHSREVAKTWEAFRGSLSERETNALAGGALDSLRQATAVICESLSDLELETPRSGWYAPLLASLDDATDATWRSRDLLVTSSTTTAPPAAPSDAGDSLAVIPESKKYDTYRLDRLRDAVNALQECVEEFCARLADQPVLLVIGDAGTGKTHLLCDVALQRSRGQLPTLLLMGQQFGAQLPWEHMIQRLGLDCTRDELLGALQAAAECAGGRALILIDAINEADEVSWRDELPAMLEVIARFPRIGIAVTCRSTYERHNIRNDLVPGRMTRIEHQGFASALNEALAAFFKYYDIEGFNTPPLAPEFENPLFLKLVCDGLRRLGLHRPPRGFRGLTGVFGFLIDSVNEHLARSDQLDYIPHERFVHQAVDQMTDEMVRCRSNTVPVAAARQSLERLLPRPGGHGDSLLGKLLSEGLLTQDLLCRRNEEQPVPVVRFTYERFADHQIARRLLEEHLDIGAVEASFAEGTILGRLARSSRAAGLLTALCIQVPERTGRQLFDLVPDCFTETPIPSAFVASLPWLAPRFVDASVIARVQSMLTEPESAYFGELLDALLSIAGEPEHPLNARWLHQYLRALPMPERDATWSIFLHHQRGRGQSVDRWIQWAWPLDCEVRDPASFFDDQTLVLCGLTLGWFLTSSNRFVRDRATKALVSLFCRHVGAYREVLSQFEGVNDPYVAERLYTVAYGSAVRSGDRTAVAALAEQVYRQVFEAGHPPVHVLLRHYARQVVEYALHLGCELHVDPQKIRPPYQSPWPLAKPPAWEELRAQYDGKSYGHLIISLWPDSGDFARYVLFTDSPSGVHSWTDQGPPPPEDDEDESGAAEEYPPELQAKFAELLESIGTQFRVASPDEPDEDEEDEAESEALPQNWWSSLSGEQQGIIATRLAGVSSHDRWLEWAERAFLKSDLAPRWILVRVMELGWTPERFANFDQEVSHGDSRLAKKPERIGKKYQWIALHEFLAHLLDHRAYRHEQHAGTIQYDCPSDRYDIDPSVLVRGREDRANRGLEAWWAPVPSPLQSRTLHMDDREWLQDGGSIPDPTPMLEVRQPGGDSAWYAVEGALAWEEADDSLDRRKASDPRRLSFSFGAFLVRVEDLAVVVEWMKRAELNGMDTDVPHLSSAWLGDYGWAAGYAEFSRDATVELAPDAVDNTQIRRFRDAPAPLAHTTMLFLGTEGFDCSSDGTVTGYVPSLWIAKKMSIFWGRYSFRFVDQAGTLVAFDPSHEEAGPGALLVRKDRLDGFLAESGLVLVWHVVGEKTVIGDIVHKPDWPGRVVFRRIYHLHEGTLTGTEWSTVRR